MTHADELRDAAETLRGIAPLGDTRGPLAVWEPLAKLLSDCADLHEPQVCQKHEGCGPIGCQWCADEDSPCADVRNALAVARAITGSQP